MTSPNLDISVANGNTGNVPPPVAEMTNHTTDIVIKVTDTSTQNGREWNIVDLPLEVRQALQSKIQAMQSSCSDCYSSLSSCISDCCGEVLKKCCSPKMIASAIVTVICGGIIIYGSVCIQEGRDGDPSYACTHDKYGREVSAQWNGGWMVAAGIVACLGGVIKICCGGRH
jgi:hypothetical protein